MPIHIPHLRDKLALLYKSGRHPGITSHASLAAEMGVVTPQITNWLNGNAGMQESSLPDAKLQPFCRLFMLNVEDVLTDDLTCKIGLCRMGRAIAKPITYASTL
ncbi:MAG: hypothetical protein HOP34_07365 [Methylococcaceae bacterium]|nr:hypothetical protein [Methylococcaceae bacterium]